MPSIIALKAEIAEALDDMSKSQKLAQHKALTRTYSESQMATAVEEERWDQFEEDIGARKDAFFVLDDFPLEYDTAPFRVRNRHSSRRSFHRDSLRASRKSLRASRKSLTASRKSRPQSQRLQRKSEHTAEVDETFCLRSNTLRDFGNLASSQPTAQNAVSSQTLKPSISLAPPTEMHDVIFEDCHQGTESKDFRNFTKTAQIVNPDFESDDEPDRSEVKAPQQLFTWMLRNIPCKLYQYELIRILNTIGLRDKFNFFFTPVDAKKNAMRRNHKNRNNANNKGYGFINLKRKEDSDFLFKLCHDRNFWGKYSATNSKKKCQIMPSTNQGFLENIRYFKYQILDNSLVTAYSRDMKNFHGGITSSRSLNPTTFHTALGTESNSPAETPKINNGKMSVNFTETNKLTASHNLGNYPVEYNFGADSKPINAEEFRDSEVVFESRAAMMASKRKKIVEAMQMPYFVYAEHLFENAEQFVRWTCGEHNFES